jgi:hypothetical protein
MRTGIALCALLIACGPSGSRETGGADADTGCVDGARRCVGNALETCASNSFTLTEQCATACDAQLGCVACVPGTGTCNGEVSSACRPDGSGFEEIHCDPVQGMSCDANSGVCTGACAPQNLGNSYIGCEYYPTVTAQLVSSSFEFAVAVSNTAGLPTTITIDGGALATPVTFDVAPQSVSVRKLPWVNPLKMCSGSGIFGCTNPDPFDTVLAVGGAYRLRSTQPITAYQFSPLDYTDGAGGFTYTNDASLLLPRNVLSGNYVVAAWPYWPSAGLPGLMAVTATTDATQVTITPRAASQGTPSFPANTPTSVTLNRGDVVQLVNRAGDLTGSVVSANKPVQVIGGHYCTNVPLDVTACDHLESTMFPVETLSSSYIVTMPAVPPLPNGKSQVIRVIATAPNTVITYDPPIGGAPTTIANIGDFIELSQQQGDYVISANQKVLVAQYMTGQSAGGNTGDPAMTLAVATDQYRTSYLFHAPTNYEVNYVNVTAPIGAVVTLDGVQVTGFSPIGTSDYAVARVQLSGGPANDGNHSVTSSQPFGVSVYGYGQYTSYWYPGGLDLATIPID